MQLKDSKTVFAELLGADRTVGELPLIPLRDTVVFPRSAMPVVVTREQSMKALDECMRRGQLVVAAAQRSADTDNPGQGDLYGVGTLAKVRELVKQEDGSIRVLVEGLARVAIRSVSAAAPFVRATVEPLTEQVGSKSEKTEALAYSVINQFRRVVNMGANVSFDVMLVILNTSDPWLLCDLIAANVEFSVAEKQSVLEAADAEEKLGRVGRALGRQLKILQMASKIQAETGKELDKMQREIFLREQIRSIERELESIGGKPDDDGLKDRIESAGMPKAVLEKALKEYRRLQAMPTFSAEQSYVRAYLECLSDLPWDRKDESAVDLAQSKRVLDEDHFGLNKVKERVLEFLAVQKLVGKSRGSILCFAGPPGTGKTSIGKSVARSLGRKFHRLSLGGVHDEAEIRGHRRTYVGALSGRIIQGIAAVGTRNPVFMLDEIDKIGSDFRGDPSAALLEALDPEQNSEFSDHYLDVPFDLSDVMFITTANVLDTVPPALRDRMEVIEFPGYTETEKLNIARSYLVPKSLKASGLEKRGVRFDDAALKVMIRSYTREAGVRNMEREIMSVCRKIAKSVVDGGKIMRTVRKADLERLLGPRQFSHMEAVRKDEVGVVTGLAWTEAGGEILQIEATAMPGKGELILTGQLGSVMQESARAALSFVRSHVQPNGAAGAIAFGKDTDIHIHVPSGAIPKDGPSAGLAMATALASLLTGLKVDRTVGMTGEITLRGRALEIGGLKEKSLAAHRAGLKRIILPAENRKDLAEIPEEVRREVEFVFVERMEQVLALILKR